jgi:hypothetical protein
LAADGCGKNLPNGTAHLTGGFLFVIPASRQDNFFESSALRKTPDYTLFGMLFHLLRLSIYRDKGSRSQG